MTTRAKATKPALLADMEKNTNKTLILVLIYPFNGQSIADHFCCYILIPNTFDDL